VIDSVRRRGAAVTGVTPGIDPRAYGSESGAAAS
jgi:hypothetical protein